MRIWALVLAFLVLVVVSKSYAAETLTVAYRDHKGLHQVTVKGDHKESYRFSHGDKHIKLATLNWSPYISRSICKHGWVFQSTVALLHSMGYGASISYYPWARAMAVVESGKADVLFPEYFIEPEAPSDVFRGTRRLDHLSLSKSFGWGPIAFLARSDFDSSAFDGKLSSLVNERIGVVRGYQNTPDFDRMMDRGDFAIVSAVDDLTNVELLLNNRVNYIVGDPEVVFSEVRGSSKSTQEKQRILSKLTVVDPILRMNALFYAVSKRSEYNDVLLFELNQAIESFKEFGTFEEIKYQVQRSCSKSSGSDVPLQGGVGNS